MINATKKKGKTGNVFRQQVVEKVVEKFSFLALIIESGEIGTPGRSFEWSVGRVHEIRKSVHGH